MKVTGWMQSGELQRRAAGRADWLTRLRGKDRKGWSVENHNWTGNGSPVTPGHGLRGAVVRWYLPVLVVNEEKMKSEGVRLNVPMKRVTMAVGRATGGAEQAVRIRCRQEWHRYKMSRKQLVGITGERVQADGGSGVLVEGKEIWEEWTGQTLEEERQGAVKGEGASSSEKGLEQGHGVRQGVRQRLRRASDIGQGEPWMLLGYVWSH